MTIHVPESTRVRESVQIVPTRPFLDQAPGTSGLRKKVSVFQQPHYLENFIQSAFDVLATLADGRSLDRATLIVGGDGRYYNAVVLQVILKMAVANGVGRLIVGQHGLLSTPAASYLARVHAATGGLVLSASHNPGGIQGDFGIKVHVAGGTPASDSVVEALVAQTRRLEYYRIVQMPNIDVQRCYSTTVGTTRIDVVDPVADYADFMEQLFDFAAIRRLLASGFRLCFDAMHAVTGPYAREIFENRLGAPAGTVIHGDPREDFGETPPDPNPIYSRGLISALCRVGGADFGAASDGDGDRHLIMGKNGFFVTPSDSLAILVQHAALCPGYREGLVGVARSAATSTALDRVAESLRIPCFETPTGWKFFGKLLAAGRITMCGEESFGAGSSHLGEKDGLWAVLMWLNILAEQGGNPSVEAIVRQHWEQFGRTFYARHDYEGLDPEVARRFMDSVKADLPFLVGRSFMSRQVKGAEPFTYVDPIDPSVVIHQGIRIILDGGGRFFVRLSGTGTEGETLRVYLEKYESRPGLRDQSPRYALGSVEMASRAILDLGRRIGQIPPSLIVM